MNRGCLVMLVLGVAQLLGCCAAFNYWHVRSVLPDGLDVQQVQAFNSEGFFREGCTYGRYITTGYLKAAANGGWQDTPFQGKRHPVGCEPDGDTGPSPRLDKPGYLHREIHGGDGLIVIEPSSGLTWFYYAG